MMTEPLPDELIQRISPIRGAYSDIRPVIDYLPGDQREPPAVRRRHTLRRTHSRRPQGLESQADAEDLPLPGERPHRPRLGCGPMACSANLFPQIGSLSGRPNAFFVQGYSGFGVHPQPHRLQGTSPKA
ncbi:putative oxidoreductase [Pseudomonas aeruginosa]|nr:putative oxidoreductase [Pseudomonas aeruginosa]